MKTEWYSPLDDSNDVPQLPRFILDYIYQEKCKGSTLYRAILIAPKDVYRWILKDTNEDFAVFWLMFDVEEGRTDDPHAY